MVKNLYINGCSFLSQNKRAGCRTHAGLEVAKLLNLNPISIARGGRGNDRIIAVTREFFYNNPEAIKDTFVLIGWSAALRKDCLSGKPRKGQKLTEPVWKSWKYTDMVKLVIKKNVHLSDINIKDTLKMEHLCGILAMQDFFEAHGIKYCMYDALNNQRTASGKVWQKLFEKAVNKDKFFGFNEINHFDFVNKGADNLNCSYGKVTDEHPSQLGHELWAAKLVKFIEENNLLERE